jgi:hypothetical protein
VVLSDGMDSLFRRCKTVMQAALSKLHRRPPSLPPSIALRLSTTKHARTHTHTHTHPHLYSPERSHRHTDTHTQSLANPLYFGRAAMWVDDEGSGNQSRLGCSDQPDSNGLGQRRPSGVGLTPFLCFNGRLRWIFWLQRFPCVCFITQHRVQIILLICGGHFCFRLLVTVLHC